VIYKHHNFNVNVKLHDLDEEKIKKIKKDIDLKIKPHFQEDIRLSKTFGSSTTTTTTLTDNKDNPNT